MISKGKANIIIDGQWGSTGKGKLAGWLYNNYDIDVAICDFMPNAGHTYVDDNRQSHVLCQLPMGSIFPNVKQALVGPHAVIDKKKLIEEIEYENIPDRGSKIKIHPLASMVSELDRDQERKGQNKIASTMKGSMAATIRKMKRGETNFRKVYESKRLCWYAGDTHKIAQEAIRKGETILIETAQGFDLGLNHGFYWPYTTSRDCLLGRALDNAGLSPKHMGKIIACLRTYPIRVGNTKDGYSGPFYEDQKEITWQEISDQIGYNVIEHTTVTKRVRRVFTFSFQQLERFLQFVEPDYAFMNFCNYLPEDTGLDFLKEVDKKMNEYGCKLKLLGTGAENYEMIDFEKVAHRRKIRFCEGMIGIEEELCKK